MSKQKVGLVPRLRFPEFRKAEEWGKKELRQVAAILNKKAGNNKYTLMSITAGVGLVTQLEKFGREIAGAQYKNYLVIEKNDFAFNKSATKEYPEGFIGIYSGNEPGAVPNSIFTCFRVDASNVSPKYLDYLFKVNLHGKWLKKFITVGARAHGSLNIDDNDLLALPVPLPQGDHSLKEQQKIADCLSSLDTLIAAQADKLDALKTHKRGLMQQLFPREGETIPRLRFPKFRGTREWDLKPLSQYFGNIRNGFVGTATPHYVPSGIAYLQGKNIKKGQIDTAGLFFVSSEFHQGQKKSQLHVGDVLMVQSGHVGECAVVDEKFSGANCHALIILPPKDKVHSTFFVQYFYSPHGRKKISNITTGNTIKHILASDVKSLIVCVPSSKEQQKIGDFLSSLDTLIAAQVDKLDALKTHKKGLMQQLFPNPEAVAA